jgi:hypothetical protein
MMTNWELEGGRKEGETTYREDRTKNTTNNSICRQSGCSDEEVCIDDIIEESQLLRMKDKCESQYALAMWRQKGK